MHKTAYNNGSIFFSGYSKFFEEGSVVVDIGSQNVNGTLKDHVPDNFKYIGVDFVSGNGVDVVLEDPYKFPFEDESIDIVISSSCFEHSEFFWVTFAEIIRCLKPNGIFYLNAPSGGRIIGILLMHGASILMLVLHYPDMQIKLVILM